MKAMASQAEFPLARVQLLNWLVLLAMLVGAWIYFSPAFAQSLAVGGLLANGSFIALRTSLEKIMAGPLNVAKLRFFMKYYARLMVLALVLYVLVRYWRADVAGLLVGLSTVVLSILLTAASELKKTYFTAKEAA